MQVFMWANVFFFLGIYLEVELLGHVITLCLIIWGTAKLFLNMVTPLYTPNSCVWWFQFLCIFITYYYWLFFKTIIWVFDLVILVGMKWYLIVVWFAFPQIWMKLSIFSAVYWLFACFLWRNVQVIGPLVNWIFCLFEFMRSLCILDINPFSDKWFANITPIL